MRDLQDILRTRASALEAFSQIFQSQLDLFVHGSGEDAAGPDAGLACDGDDFAGMCGGEGRDVGIGWFWGIDVRRVDLLDSVGLGHWSGLMTAL